MSINVNISHREDFPLLRDSNIVYLDNAATSQKPDCVIEAVEEFYHKHNANPLRGFYELAMLATEQLENSRTTVKEFINAKFEEEVIFTKGTTESINLIANSYGMNFLGEGDEILISIMEHHCNILPWQFVASKTGAVLKYLECDMDGLISDTAIEEAITDKTKIVAITQLSNVLGRENPIARITKTAHEHGAIVVMDAAQSVVHVKIDVQALDVDFMAFSGHKIMSPMGIGILYGKKELLNKMPPFLRGGEMIESVTRTDAVFAQLPYKFEAGTDNASGAVGLMAAINYINSIGMEYMHERTLMLTKMCFDAICKIPHIHIIGAKDSNNHNGIISFTIDNVHPHDVSQILSENNVCVRAGHHCAQPLCDFLGFKSCTRASFMFYNTQEDIDTFIKSLSGIRKMMGYGD